MHAWRSKHGQLSGPSKPGCCIDRVRRDHTRPHRVKAKECRGLATYNKLNAEPNSKRVVRRGAEAPVSSPRIRNINNYLYFQHDFI